MKVPTTRLLLVTEIWDGKPSHRKSLARNLLVWSDLTFGPLLQGQMRTAKLKSAYNSLYPPEASGGYFGLASATPPPRVERFSALTL